jgi:hypothetical protein
MTSVELRKQMENFITHFQGENIERDDLISFFYRALREVELCNQYILNAERLGNEDLAEFYKEIQAQDRLRVSRTQEFLNRHLS